MENGVVVGDAASDGVVMSDAASESVPSSQENTTEIDLEQVVDDGASNHQPRDSTNLSTSPTDCQKMNSGSSALTREASSSQPVVSSTHSTAAGP